MNEWIKSIKNWRVGKDNDDVIGMQLASVANFPGLIMMQMTRVNMPMAM